MLKYESEALRNHEALVKLHNNNPDVFESVTKTMIDKAIKKSPKPEKLKAIQLHLTKNVLNGKERKLASSLEALQTKFNGGKFDR